MTHLTKNMANIFIHANFQINVITWKLSTFSGLNVTMILCFLLL